MIYFDQFYIKPLEMEDLPAYFDLVERNRERLEDFFTGTASRTKNMEATAQFLAEIIARRDLKQYYPYLLTDMHTGELIAFFDLKNIDWSIPKSEIGCYTDQHFSGKGITTKAINKFVEFCFSQFGFKKLFLRTHSSNIAAQKIAEHCGFVQEGIIRMDYKTTSGVIVDLMYYGKVFTD